MSNWQHHLRDWARSSIPAGQALCLHLADARALAGAANAFAIANSGRIVFVTADAATGEKLTDALRNYQTLFDDPRPIHMVPEVEGFRQQWIPENEAARCAALHAALGGEPAVFIAPTAGLLAPTADPVEFQHQVFDVAVGSNAFPPETLAERLVALDYDNEVEVHMPGEFSRRGGILDVYPPLYDAPIRIEYFGDTVDTMRQFDPETQRSYRDLKTVRIIPRGEAAMEPDSEQSGSTFADFLGDDVLIVVCDPEGVMEHLERFAGPDSQQRWDNLLGATQTRLTRLHVSQPGPHVQPEGNVCRELKIYPLEDVLATFLPELGADAVTLHWQMLRDHLQRWSRQGYDIIACCGNEGEASRFQELLAGDQGTSDLAVIIEPAVLDTGTFFPDIGMVLLSEHEIFGKRVETRRRRRTQYRADYAVHDEIDLEEECNAVHAVHGICRYHGIREIEVTGVLQEALELEFADDARLFVPLDQAHLVSRYVGGSRKMPKLHRIGSASWKKSKAAAASAAFDLAAELLRLEAMRKNSPGLAYAAENDWEHAFAQSFPYIETPDQRQAIADVLEDMAKPEPMDRLLCGDVGYGKTEVAMRAAFRAVMNGKQVAVLVPTTVLAQQHYLTFRDRMAEYPVQIDVLSRFKSHAEQNETLDRLALGQIDILIGTHRLIQEDVEFSDLGLLVVDEEQRFGVKHKETLKRLRASVDILTMTATPIPRTLYFSLSGIKNLSTIMTPPAERLPIKTVVAQFDDQLVTQSIQHELQRGGQVFFLHNRVQTIKHMCWHVMKLVPEARIGIAHGQMPATELEDIMIKYVEGKLDVLVCTTIIESGLDIPNANTIIIDRADRFGLAELYQLRGRVGRYHNQAYAYLLLPPMGTLPQNARERLAAIRQYTHLGAGFKLALRDLEIRGAGNILGSEQSGHVAAVGFELYCELLREAVAQLEHKPSPSRTAVDIRLDWVSFGLQTGGGKLAAAIPGFYVESSDLRLDCYRRLSSVTSTGDVDALEEEWRDRFGAPPQVTQTLLEVARIRTAAAVAGIRSISVHKDKLLLRTEEGLLKTAAGTLPEITDGVPQQKLAEVKRIVFQFAKENS